MKAHFRAVFRAQLLCGVQSMKCGNAVQVMFFHTHKCTTDAMKHKKHGEIDPLFTMDADAMDPDPSTRKVVHVAHNASQPCCTIQLWSETWEKKDVNVGL